MRADVPSVAGETVEQFMRRAKKAGYLISATEAYYILCAREIEIASPQ
jgi:hypothetical protein